MRLSGHKLRHDISDLDIMTQKVAEDEQWPHDTTMHHDILMIPHNISSGRHNILDARNIETFLKSVQNDLPRGGRRAERFFDHFCQTPFYGIEPK